MSADLASGQILLERYRLDRRLDEGGMSVVWAGTHLLTGKRVALKLLKADAAKDEATRRRMLREARAACAVVHRNVVQIHDVLELPDGSPVLVMDLLTGESLRDRLVRQRALSLHEAATLLLPVISAVGTAHAAGVIHRDLKPENIFLAQEEGRVVVKVLDFGIAKLVPQGNDVSQINALTNTGTMLGTPYYMAPEQILGEPIDHRADVWALGVILYECLTGERPTEAENIGKILKRVLTNEIEPLSRRAPDLPPEIHGLVARMLSQASTDRPPSMREVGEVLLPWAEGSSLGLFGPPTTVVEPGSSERRNAPAAAPAETAETIRTTSQYAETLVAPRHGEPRSKPRPSRGTTEPPAVATAPTVVAPGQARPSGRSTAMLVALVGALVVAGALAGYILYGKSRERPPYVAASASLSTASPNGPCPAGMGLVPGGTFRMGSDDGKDDERPVHEVVVQSLCLDLAEVSARDYFDCMQDGACRPAESTVFWGTVPPEVKERESAQCTIYQTHRGGEPANCLSWHDADAYCRVKGKRLPTEIEWEYAAAGGAERRRFPWGNDPPGPDLVNVCDVGCIAAANEPQGKPMFDADDGAPTLSPRGKYPRGASRFGMVDMAGNVWEWTASPYCTYPEHVCTSQYRVFRGGGWGGQFVANLRTSSRMWSNPAHRYNDVGFRCAADVR